MSSPDLDILGLFPSFDSERFGGVQSSGREAWQGIVSRIGERRAAIDRVVDPPRPELRDQVFEARHPANFCHG